MWNREDQDDKLEKVKDDVAEDTAQLDLADETVELAKILAAERAATAAILATELRSFKIEMRVLYAVVFIVVVFVEAF